VSGLGKSSRARGANRGGCGGGYERTDPDYGEHRLARMRAEYESLPAGWRAQYLAGLSKFDREAVAGRRGET